MTPNLPAVAFIGLGSMGLPMALRQLEHDVPMRVFDPNSTAVQTVTAHGAAETSSPAGAATGAEFVVCILPTPDVVREVVVGDRGIVDGVESNALVIDMSTSDPALDYELAEALKDRGAHFIDAPVGRGVGAAASGNLTVFSAGDESQV